MDIYAGKTAQLVAKQLQKQSHLTMALANKLVGEFSKLVLIFVTGLVTPVKIVGIVVVHVRTLARIQRVEKGVASHVPLARKKHVLAGASTANARCHAQRLALICLAQDAARSF